MIDVQDRGALVPVSHIIAALKDAPDINSACKEAEGLLSNGGWHYLIAHDAWAPPSVVARLRAGGDLTGQPVAAVVPVYSRGE
jgi:hypothetical protein